MTILGGSFTRRRFIASTAGGALSLLAAKRASAFDGVSELSKQERAIQGIRVQSPITIPHNLGDTWVAAWGDDDNLYSPSNDTSGFHGIGLDTFLILTSNPGRPDTPNLSHIVA